MTRPLLVQEKVDFYVWQSRIREVIRDYYSIFSTTSPNIKRDFIVRWLDGKMYNWRHLINVYNQVGNFLIGIGTKNIELSKYYFYSNGFRREKFPSNLQSGFYR